VIQNLATVAIVRESVAARHTAVLSGRDGCQSLENSMSLVSRRGFLAAAVPAVAITTSLDAVSPPHYLVILTGKSKRCTRGTPRVAHVTRDRARAEHLAGKLAKHFGQRFVSIREGGAA
jgi:hypothetical protein